MPKIRRALISAAAFGLGVGLFSGLAPIASDASSHREAPLTAADPQIDNTDVYAFRSPDQPKTITLISSWIPFEEPAGGPNFYLWAEHTNYDIKIDNDGDAIPDITYRWTFTTHFRNPNTFLYNTGPVTSLNDADLNIYQTYDLYRIKEGGHQTTLLRNAPVVPSDVGEASMPDYDDLLRAGVKSAGVTDSWVGQSDDPFFLDLRVFDFLYGGDLSETGNDTLEGFNVNTMAIRVPRDRLRGPNDSVIGVWSTASRPSMRIQTNQGTQTFSGPNVQVSRLGNPLVNEVVVPVGLKDYFNASRPRDDAQFLPAVQNPELPHLMHAVYGIKVPDSDPNTPGIQRADLIQVFLTGVPGLNQPQHVQASEMLRLNMSTPLCGRSGAPACSRLGVLAGDLQGFPNGRRLFDDVIDIALRAAEGVLLPNHPAIVDSLGDGVNANDEAFANSFPYVAHPESGSDTSPHS
jgi:Domain of unknown function (DUF4331)